MGADAETTLLTRVRHVISQLGVPQAQFADDIGIDATKLSKALNGVRRFTSLELALIAERGGVTTDWLLTGATPSLPALAARTSDDSTDAVVVAHDKAKKYDAVFNTLERLGPSVSAPSLPKVPRTGDHIHDGSTLADAALEAVRQADHLNLLREDPASVLETVFGVNVAIDNIGTTVDGLAWQKGSFRLILVTNQIAWSRQWFTIAHEFCHILEGDAQSLHIDRDIMAPTERRHASEVRANSFAAAFMMPEYSIREDVGGEVTDTDFGTMAGKFRVSPSALAWRLRNLRIIDDERRAELGAMSTQAAANIGGWVDEYRKLAEQQSRPRVPKLLAEQAFTAWSSGVISVRPLAAVLDVPPESMLPSPIVPFTPGEPVAEEPVFLP